MLLINYLKLFVYCWAMYSMSVTAKSMADYLGDLNAEATTEEVTQSESHLSIKATDANLIKMLNIKITELKDNSGLTYIGGEVSSADLASYLQQMKSILSDDFIQYRQNQALRDHQTFHVTLINPFEYREINQQDIELGKSLSITLQGLGRVTKENKSSYFVVVQSSAAQFYRQKLALAKKDFHVTLGFHPQDIYGVNKGIDTLITDKVVETVQ